MEDEKIIELYFKRDEHAISETAKKYSSVLSSVSRSILGNNEDALECVNDTYFRAWNSIPPNKPDCLSAYLSSIVRNLSIDRYDSQSAEKRGGGEYALSLDELGDCVSGEECETEEGELSRVISEFLVTGRRLNRMMFVRRYYFSDSIAEIAKNFGIRENTVKTGLCRMRKRLKIYLEKEGIKV